jgi:hypothetical protein
MKKLVIVVIAVALLVTIGLLLWPRLDGSRHDTNSYSTRVQLSGAPGTAFTGEYVRDGKRVSISGAVPWSLTESNISRWEIRKAKMDDTLVLDARGGGSVVSTPCGPDSKGLRLYTEGGWRVEFIR